MPGRAFVSFVTYYLLTSDLCGGTTKPACRRKRIVYGNEHLEPSEYRSTEYFVWIGNGHECDIPLPDSLLKALDLSPFHELPTPDLGFVCSPKSHHLRCTGSLLMPRLVQTACHCVVEFVSSTEEESRPVKINVDERRFRIYPGRYLLSSMKNGVAANRYIHHPKCWETFRSVLYDYALIVLEGSMKPFQRTYAPVYHVEGLASMWTELMRKRKICLVIGFGAHQAKYGPNSFIKSPVLLHGWMITMDFMSCYYKTVVETGRREYREKATWFCSIPMPRNYTSSEGAAGGDSGGPVTCDNEYLGIVSHSIDQIDLPAPIAFTPLENSATYRRQLKKYLEETDDVMYTTHDPVGYKYFPTSKPINEIRGRNKAGFAPAAVHSGATLLFPTTIITHVITVSINIILNS